VDSPRQRYRSCTRWEGPLGERFAQLPGGQNDGIKEVAEQNWLVTFMQDELIGRGDRI
jgi:hypothetical protein